MQDSGIVLRGSALLGGTSRLIHYSLRAQSGRIHQYFESLKQGAKKKIGHRDLFEIVSNQDLIPYSSSPEKQFLSVVISILIRLNQNML